MQPRASRRPQLFLTVILTLAAVALACTLPGQAPAESPSAPPESTATATPAPAETSEPTTPPPTPTATIEHFVTPAAPGGAERFVDDVDSSSTAAEGRVVSGENFRRNRLERPFTQGEMSYRPDVDITRAELALDETWVYFTIEVQAPGPVGNGYPGTYSVELDLDLDGRGDLLVMAESPAAVWSTQGVTVWSDGNDDVGGEVAYDADQSTTQGDGYETNLFDQGRGEDPDAAWARIAPDVDGVNIAAKRDLIGDLSFLWSVWAQIGSGDPSSFDFVDRFTPSEAGSPLADSEHYPLDQLAAVDNTCRMYHGFTPSGTEPGICLVFGTVQNCTFHPMRMVPGDVIIPMVQEAGSIKDDVTPGTYSFYDQNVEEDGEHPLVLTAQVRPGGLVQIVTDGNGNTWECP
ncbi:MAG: hypothetical protein R3191_03735 [Anaerolineales bacterium]|nr:hypothetical protein [Anaerolineales bacterium]